MKKALISILFISVLISCSTSNESEVFQSDKLIGKYDVDLSPFISSTIKSDENDDGWDKMSKGIAGLALSSMDVELSFYENNKGIMHFSGGFLDFANAFSDNPSDNTNEFVYKVKNDSVLYAKNKGEKEFKKWAIVRSFSSNYDYVKLLIIKENKKSMFFNLKKVK